MQQMLNLFLFALVAVKSVAQTRVNAGLINTVALVNDRVELTCRTTEGYSFSQWLFTPVGSTATDVVYSRERDVDKRFTRVVVILNSKGLCTLAIDHTQLVDAGIYTCKTHRLISGGGIDLIKESAQLIVLGDAGKCTNVSTSVAEGVVFEMRCIIHYRGDWAPTTEWIEKEENKVVTDGVDVFTFPNASIVSTLTLSTNSNMNGKRYEFRTFFTKYRPTGIGYFSTNATNIPNNTYSWTSPPLSIIYGPKRVRITPHLTSYNVGDRLVCSADANPAPHYEWIDQTNILKSNGSVFVIRENLHEQFILECKATNEVSSMKTYINFTVHSVQGHAKSTDSSESSGSSANLFLLALVPTPLLLVILVVVVCRQLCSKQEEPRTTNEKLNRTAAEMPSGDPSFDIGPESTDSYTSIPSVAYEGEMTEVKPPFRVESTEADPDENLIYSAGYSELEPREIPPPTTYSRLLKSRLDEQANVATNVVKKKNDYVNVPSTASKSNTTECTVGFYNVDVEHGRRDFQNAVAEP